MSTTMSETEVLSQRHDELSLAADAAREDWIVLSRATDLIEDLCGGVLEVGRKLNQTQFEDYMIVLRAETRVLDLFARATDEATGAFRAYYKAQYGIDLDAAPATEPAPEG